MNISHELQDDKAVLLNITLTCDEIKDKVAEQLKQMRKNAETPGFRPGKTPASIIEKKYGQAIRFSIINKQISNEIPHYLDEQGIKTVGGLLMVQDDNSYKPEQTDYQLQVSTGVLPTFPTTFDSSVTLPYYTVATDQDEIDKIIADAQQSYGERTEVEDVQDKDVLYLSVQELDDKGAHAPEGIALEETFLMPSYITDEEIRKTILEAHKGDTLTLDLHKAYDGSETEIASFLQIDKEEVKDHTNPFEVKIKRILRNTPHAIDEKLYKLILGPDTTVTTEEELRAEIQKTIEERNANMSDKLFGNTVLRYVLEQTKDLPFSNEHLALLLEDKDDEESQEEYEKRINGVIPYLRYQYILSDLSKQMGVEVSEEMIRSILTDNVKSQIQSIGLGQLLSNESFIERVVSERIAEDGEDLFSAREEAKLQAFTSKIKESVTLDEQEPVSINEIQDLIAEVVSQVKTLFRGSAMEDNLGERDEAKEESAETPAGEA